MSWEEEEYRRRWEEEERLKRLEEERRKKDKKERVKDEWNNNSTKENWPQDHRKYTKNAIRLTHGKNIVNKSQNLWTYHLNDIERTQYSVYYTQVHNSTHKIHNTNLYILDKPKISKKSKLSKNDGRNIKKVKKTKNYFDTILKLTTNLLQAYYFSTILILFYPISILIFTIFY